MFGKGNGLLALHIFIEQPTILDTVSGMAVSLQQSQHEVYGYIVKLTGVFLLLKNCAKLFPQLAVANSEILMELVCCTVHILASIIICGGMDNITSIELMVFR